MTKQIQMALGVILAGGILAGLSLAGILLRDGRMPTVKSAHIAATAAELEEKILPAAGVKLPIRWGDLGLQLTATGVIDGAQFISLHQRRGELTEENMALLDGAYDKEIIMTEKNAGLLLNLFWAFGLANKNVILEQGPMSDPRYGGAGRFASTGGWSLARPSFDGQNLDGRAKGDAMNHYSAHPFVELTEEQQALVERVSKNIYRPCCGNSTYFPDCNHGMAMLGLLELMAAQGAGEEEMYRVALQVNAYWFPDTYLTIAKYLEEKGIAWESADPKEILGANYSSGAGFQRILAEVAPPEQRGGGSCGV